MAPDFKNLRELLSWISKRVCKETTEARADKRRASRDLAHGFCELLNKEPGISIREEPTVKSANYFCAEIGGKPVWISPFASHDGWWEKPSKGFRDKVERHSGVWGIVLFDLLRKEGVWIEGTEFDAKVLKGCETVHSQDVDGACRNGLAISFSTPAEFVRILQGAIRGPEGPIRKHREGWLVKKTKKGDEH